VNADEKWLVGIVIALLALYYPSVIGAYNIAANLHGRDKLPPRVWRASTVLFGIAMGLPAVAAGGFLVYSRGSLTILLLAVVLGSVAIVLSWQHARTVAAWRHSWPPLVMLATLALVTIAVVRTRDLVVIVLSITTPLFAWYLLRDRFAVSLMTTATLFKELRARLGVPPSPSSWAYDFIQHLNDDTTRCYSTGHEEPWSIRRIRNALSDGDIAEDAIFEHPPYHGDAVMEYRITGIDPNLDELWIKGRYAILERFDEYDGTQGQITHFDPFSDNRVRFDVRVDGEAMWDHETSDLRWQTLEIGPFQPHAGRLTVEFRTNALGETSCNWAAWAALRLVACP
jgi:hypothetical protein